MKAIMYYDEKTIQCEEIAKPDIKHGEILVRMRACGICGGDIMHWYRKTKAPCVLGHEITGEIVQVSGEVNGFEIGDRVFVHHHVACFTCHFCVHGDYIHCSQFHTNQIFPGGFAEFIRVSAPLVKADVLKLPENVTFEYGTLIEPLACCLKGISKTIVTYGDSLLIIGAGPIGLMNIELAKKVSGVSRIIVSETLETRIEQAKRFGADVVIDPLKQSLPEVVKDATNGIGVDAVMVNVSNLQAIREGLESVRNGGILVLFAPPQPEEAIILNPNALFFTEKHITASYTASHIETRQALKLLASGKVDFQSLITNRFEMEKAQDAFHAAEGRKGLKVVITNS